MRKPDVLTQLRRRANKQAPEDLINKIKAACFDEQLEFVNDRSMFKVGLCTRRAGKTEAVGFDWLTQALERPGGRYCYLASTIDVARTNFFEPVLMKLKERFDLDAELHLTLHRMQLANGSIIRVYGADSSARNLDKLRGSKWDGVCVDEPQSFSQNLTYLVEDVITNTITDRSGGQAVLIGTPGQVRDTWFHKVCDGRVKGWNVHKWSWHDNPHVREARQNVLNQILEADPNFINTTKYKREWCGEWVADESMQIYKYSSRNTDVDVIPVNIGRLTYVVGVDFGSNDASAIVVGCWGEHDNRLYVVDYWQATGVDYIDVGEQLKEFQKKYPITVIVCDHAKQGAETIRRRCGVPLTNAEKSGLKETWIDWLNADLSRGTIKLMPKVRDFVTNEWNKLIWDQQSLDKGIRREDPRCANHVSDALNYMWRTARNYSSRAKDKTNDPPQDPNDRIRWEQDRREREAIDRIANESSMIDAGLRSWWD